MKYLLLMDLFVPLLGSFLVSTVGKQSEGTTFTLVRVTKWIYGLSVLSTIVFWWGSGGVPFNWYIGDIYRSPSYHFPIVLLFDLHSAVFLGVTAYMYLVIARFSRYYMHREEGYTRFFSTILLFIFGMSALIIAGTIDLLFAGWEIVGISSFLLIAFYRERITPVRNALTTYAIYRVCDVGVLLGAWLSHVIWHESQQFNNLEQAMRLTQGHPLLLFFLSLLLLLAAAGKSAQFPFCFWLSRAMEGPTPSSAIFYGALSVHAGVFLLMRFYPVWHSVEYMPLIVGGVGLLSALIGTLSGRTQSNIKGQIAYSSLAQVGLMLIELAAGFPNLALVHFVGNAGLRSYQLLVSPSVVAYILRMQGTPGSQRKVSEWSLERRLPNRLRSTLYALSFNEAYLASAIRVFFQSPLQSLGNAVHFVDGRGGRIVGLSMGIALVVLHQIEAPIPGAWLAAMASFFALAASLSALSERKLALRAWNAVGFSDVFLGLAMHFVGTNISRDVGFYLLGIIPAWFIGRIFLIRLVKGLEDSFQLESHWGRASDQALSSFLLFDCFLALAGFPIGPAFIGEDALLHHAVNNNLWLAIVFVFAFIVNGISLCRIFSRVCLGPRSSDLKPRTDFYLN